MAITPVAKSLEEIEDFFELEELELTEQDGRQSYKSNQLIINQNNTKQASYVNNLLSFVRYILSNGTGSGPSNPLVSNKIILPIVSTIAIGAFVTDDYNNNTYKIHRLDKYKIVISCTTISNWDVSSLMVQIKQLDGTFIYPTIKTANNVIELYFLDELNTNYKAYIA